MLLYLMPLMLFYRSLILSCPPACPCLQPHPCSQLKLADAEKFATLINVYNEIMVGIKEL